MDEIPNEILDMIAEHSSGVAALFALVEANKRARALFERRPHAMLLGAMHSSSMEIQLQKILCVILSIRQCRRHSDDHEKASQAYIAAHLRDQSTDIHLDLDPRSSSDAIHILKDAVKIYEDITQAVESLARIQLPKPPTRIHTSINRDRFHGRMRHRFTLSFKEPPQSPTELYRIRRAFWRLRLYFEAFYEPYLVLQTQIRSARSPTALALSGTPQKDPLKAQAPFFSHLTVWELEEMECAWYQLNEQSRKLWRRRCPHCREHLLPDDLVEHSLERNYRTGLDLSRFVCNFENACAWFRMDLEDNAQGSLQLMTRQ